MLFLHIGWHELLSTLKRLDPLLGIATAFCLFSLFVLGGFNIWVLLRSLYPIPFLGFMVAFLHSFSIGLIAPGQLGDASLTVFLRRIGVPLHKTGVAYLIDKVITLGWFCVVSSYGVYLLAFDMPKQVGLFLLLLCILAASGVSFVFWMRLSSTRTAKLLMSAIQPFWNTAEILFEKWYLPIANFSITLIKWLVMAASYELAFLSFGTSVPWPFIAIIPVLSTLIGYIPISAGGVGTVEWSAVYWFSLVGVTKSDVLTVYILLRAIQYAIACGLMLFVPMLHRSKLVEAEAKQ